MRLARGVLLALLLGAWAAPAESQSRATILLDSARAQIDAFDFDAAQRLVVQVLAQPVATPRERQRAAVLMGIIRLLRSNGADRWGARNAFQLALRLDPGYVLPDSLADLHSDARVVFAEAQRALARPAAERCDAREIEILPVAIGAGARARPVIIFRDSGRLPCQHDPVYSLVSTNHNVAVVEEGAVVGVAPGTAPLVVRTGLGEQMVTGAGIVTVVDCARPATAVANRGACYDRAPVPRSLPVASVPSSCALPLRVAEVLVRVDTAGKVQGEPVPVLYGSSGCEAFDQTAVALVQDVAFVPARKEQRAVNGYAIVPVRPRGTTVWSSACDTTTLHCYDVAPQPIGLGPLPAPEVCGAVRGSVLARVVVGVDGVPTEVTLQRASDCTAFNRAVREYLMSLRYQPATRGGRPVRGARMVYVQPAGTR